MIESGFERIDVTPVGFFNPGRGRTFLPLITDAEYSDQSGGGEASNDHAGKKQASINQLEFPSPPSLAMRLLCESAGSKNVTTPFKTKRLN